MCRDFEALRDKLEERFFYLTNTMVEANNLLRMLQEQEERERVTLCILETDTLDLERQRLLPQIARRSGPFAGLKIATRFIFCLSESLDTLYDGGLMDESLYLCLRRRSGALRPAVCGVGRLTSPKGDRAPPGDGWPWGPDRVRPGTDSGGGAVVSRVMLKATGAVHLRAGYQLAPRAAGLEALARRPVGIRAFAEAELVALVALAASADADRGERWASHLHSRRLRG